MAQNTPAASGNKTIGPLPGCQLEEALAGRLAVADHTFASAPDPTKGLPRR